MRTTIRRGTSLLAAVLMLAGCTSSPSATVPATPASPLVAVAAPERAPAPTPTPSGAAGITASDIAADTTLGRWMHPTSPRCPGAVDWATDPTRIDDIPVGSTTVDAAIHGEVTPPHPARRCPTNYGDLPPLGDLEAEVARLGDSIDAWIARLEAERLEAERLEAERLEAERREAARRQAARPAARTAPTRPGSGSGGTHDGDGDWYDMGEQGDTVQGIPGMCVANCTPGVTNDIPPKPEGCINGHYDTAWGGWNCLYRSD